MPNSLSSGNTVAAAGAAAPLLVLEDVTKIFDNGTVAVRGVSASFQAGTVHGVVGANGAGKSTLIKIISGALQRTSGHIRWKGKEVHWSTPSEPLRAGIATVQQHTPLVPTLSVAENAYLGNREGRFWWNAGQRRAQFLELLRRVDYQIDPSTLVSELSVGERQMVAMLKALAEGPSLLVLDEPTASLAHDERRLVYRTVRQLAGELGTAILYVSHLLDEIMELTDHVTVLRDGRVVLDLPTSQLDEAMLVRGIVGRESTSFANGAGSVASAAPVVLSVENLQSPGTLAPTSLAVRRGEVVGIAGLLGSGRSELLQAIFGADPHASGTVRVDDKRVRLSPSAMVAAGLALVPEDRNRQGLIADWEIWRNITLPGLNHVSWRRLLPQRGLEVQRAEDAITALSIKTPSPQALVRELSGGNAQKVVFAKWLYKDVKVMLLDEPSAGIDIGAKRDIQQLIRSLAADGLAVVIVDSEFDELLLVSDRVLVMHRGELVDERMAGETDEAELVSLASGLGRTAKSEALT
jgi:ribose transport system ATP-binding protein